MKSLRKARLKGKTVIVRTDFNVPVKNNKVVDDSRIKAALPTLRFLLRNSSKVIIVTHLGRPKGFDKSLSLDPVAQRLADLLGRTVMKFDGIPCSVPYKLSMLPNIRFFGGESKNSAKFAKQIASLGDVYVNEAFSDCHRKHASVCAVTKYLPSYPGFMLENEVAKLSKLRKPKRPFVVVVGGAKIKTKIDAIDSMDADAILVGGAIAFTFLKSVNIGIGKSKFEPSEIRNAKKLLKSGKVILPVDFVCGNRKGTNAKVCAYDKIPKSLAGFDIGPETRKIFAEIISRSKTVFWNGPMGLFEVAKYSKGTRNIAKAIAESKAYSVIGGGETITAVDKMKIKGFSFVSMGGGASLSFLEGNKLAGLVALKYY